MPRAIHTIVVANAIAVAALAGTATPATANVRETGAFETNISVEVPSYYEVAPNVSLAYSSAGPNGPVGVGWRLNAGSTVRRVSRTYGAARFDASDTFFVDGQELVPCAGVKGSPGCDNGATHTFRIETFQRVIFDDGKNVWTITDKDGTTHRYRAQLGKTGTSSTTLTWAVDRVADRVGHEVFYEYACDADRECYVSVISYGDGFACKDYGHDVPPGTSLEGGRIAFEWEPRPDVITVATGAGFEETRNRLRRIKVSHARGQVRAFELGYTASTGSGTSLLHEVRELGSDNTTRGRTRTFDYPAAMGSMSPFSSSETPVNGTFLLGPFGGAPQALAPTWTGPNNVVEGKSDDGFISYADVNGDGLADFIHAEFFNGCSDLRVTTRLAGATSDVVGHFTFPGRPFPYQYPQTSACVASMNMIDLDGDGRKDLMFENWPSTTTIGLPLVTLMATGGGNFDGALESSSSAAWGIIPGRCAIGDVNGDGREDYACFGVDGTLVSELSVGAGNFTEQHAAFASPVSIESTLRLVDVNGDGLDDAVIVGLMSNGNSVFWEIRTGIGDGLGGFTFESPQETTLDASGTFVFGQTARYNVLVGDFDGDGRRDLMVAIQSATDTRLQLALNRGTGATRWVTSAETVTGLTDKSVISVGDLDLDSTTDLTVAYHHGTVTNCNPSLPEHFETWPVFRKADGTFYGGATANEDWMCGAPLLSTRAPQPVDANGDGRPDWITTADVGNGMVAIMDQPATNVTFGKRAWQRADVNGDGREDWVAVVFGNPGIDISTVVTQPDGSLQRMPEVHIASSAQGESMRADSVRQWFAMDVGGPAGTPDGRTDIVVIDDSVRAITTLLSNGDGTWTSVVSSHSYSTLRTPQRWVPLDFDGDGRMDLVRLTATSVATPPSGTTPGVAVLALRAAGDGTWEMPPGAPSTVFVGSVTPRLSSFRAIDFDGDGRGDLVQIDSLAAAPGSSAITTTLRTLRSQNDGTFVGHIASFPQSHPDGQHYQVVDINGDGRGDLARIDLVAGGAPAVTYALGIGDGTFTSVTAQPIDGMVAPATGDHRKFYAADLDQDGRTDFYTLMVDDAANGSATTTLQVVWNRANGFVSQPVPGLALAGRDTPQFQLDDANADGRPDLVRLGFSVDRIILDAPPARMTTMRNGMGATTQITYATSVGLGGNLPPGLVLPIVSQVAATDEVRNQSIESTSYTYRGLFYDYGQRRTVGFTTQQVDGARSRVVTTNQLDNRCGARVASTELRDSSDAVLTRTSLKFVQDTLTGSAPFVCLQAHQTIEHCEGTKTCVVTAAHTQYDGFGNVQQVVEDGDVSDPSDDRMTITPVHANTADWIVSKPASRAVWGVADVKGTWTWTLAAYTQHVYDGAADSTVPPTAGLVTSDLRWNDQTGATISNLIGHDKFGNVVTQTGPSTPFAPAGATVTTAYDCTFHRFPVEHCDGVGCTTSTWDPVMRLETSTIDLNGGVTGRSYDALGRLVGVSQPDGGSQVSTPPDWTAPSPSQHARKATTDGSPGDGVLWIDTYLDGLGRVWRTIEEGGRTVDVDYDGASDRPHRTSNPYLSSQTPRWTVNHYDAANRRTAASAPDGATRHTTYQPGSMTSNDEINASRVSYFDGYGRVSGVLEVLRKGCPGNDGCPVDNTYLTTYGYDALDRGIWIRDANNNVSTVRYDSLSNRLEDCSVDRGCEQVVYADDGHPIDATDVLGNHHHFEYDATGRLVRRVSTDPAGSDTRTVTTTWDVDPATKLPSGSSIGRVVRIEDAGKIGVSRLHTYDAMGRITTQEDCVAGTCLITNQRYDVAGRLDRVTYPDGSAAGYVYDARGLLAEISGYAMFTYDDATNLPTKTVLSNGVVESAIHSADRMWTEHVEMTAPTGNFVESLGHDPTGRVLHLDTTRGATTVSSQYGYDDLGRLRTVTSTDATLTASYDYDGIGNMVGDSTRGTIVHGSAAHPHAPTGSTSGQKLAYDKLGELVHTDHLDLEWDPDGNPVVIKDRASGHVSEFAYDGDGSRVMRTSSIGTELWFGPMVALDAKGKLVLSVLAHGQPIAQIDASGTTYLHRDHLSSIRALTDGSGRTLEERDYTTWGASKRPFTLANVIAGFAGSEQEDDGELVRLGARYYQPAACAFASADSVVPNAYVPQSLNAYAYALNDPPTITDPSGHDPYSDSPDYEPEGSLGVGAGDVDVGEPAQEPLDLSPPPLVEAQTDAPLYIPPVLTPELDSVATRILVEAVVPDDYHVNPSAAVAGRNLRLVDSDQNLIDAHYVATYSLLGETPLGPNLGLDTRRDLASMMTNAWVTNAVSFSNPTRLDAFNAATTPIGAMATPQIPLNGLLQWGYDALLRGFDRMTGNYTGTFDP